MSAAASISASFAATVLSHAPFADSSATVASLTAVSCCSAAVAATVSAFFRRCVCVASSARSVESFASAAAVSIPASTILDIASFCISIRFSMPASATFSFSIALVCCSRLVSCRCTANARFRSAVTSGFNSSQASASLCENSSFICAIFRFPPLPIAASDAAANELYAEVNASNALQASSARFTVASSPSCSAAAFAASCASMSLR